MKAANRKYRAREYKRFTDDYSTNRIDASEGWIAAKSADSAQNFRSRTLHCRVHLARPPRPLIMAEFYRIPALTLLSMLLVVFVLLYLKARTTRRLLWLVGWSLTILHQALETAGIHSHGLAYALSNSCLVL